VLDAALAPYRGKQSGETALLRQMHEGPIPKSGEVTRNLG
jgi:hypothetical protein